MVPLRMKAGFVIDIDVYGALLFDSNRKSKLWGMQAVMSIHCSIYDIHEDSFITTELEALTHLVS